MTALEYALLGFTIGDLALGSFTLVGIDLRLLALYNPGVKAAINNLMMIAGGGLRSRRRR